MKSSAIFLLTILTVIAGVEPVFAQTDTIFATYTYTMGDNDTKSDARQLCFLYAKRQCLEKAGTFVQSELSIRKTEQMGTQGSSYNELSQQDISTFTGAFVKVDIVSEQWAYSGETMALTIKVKAVVNVGSVYDQILALRSDRDLQQKLKDQQQQIALMEASIREMQKRLESGETNDIAQTRFERRDAFGRMNELEYIKQDIAQKTYYAVDKIEMGMTPKEVVTLLGDPRSKAGKDGILTFRERLAYGLGDLGTDLRGGESSTLQSARMNDAIFAYNYGNVWIVFEFGVVTCVVKSEYFRGGVGRGYYTREAIVK